MRKYLALILAGFGAVMGLLFSAVSTYDSVLHLDRQVHGIHCSYLPGIGMADTSGTSGCHATLMSAYSSIWRKDIWGGIPVALPGMAVFAFLAFAVLYLAGKQRFTSPLGSGGLLAASLIPLVTSIAMGVIAVTELHAVCKLCMGIYVSSALVFAAAVWMFSASLRLARQKNTDTEPLTAVPGIRRSHLAAGALVGILFVGLPVAVYAISAPDFSKYVGSCGKLADGDVEGKILLPIGNQNRPIQMIEVIDPLCSACAVFERRFQQMAEAEKIQRKVLLFPLDKQCNWMIEESVHPGACAVSEAMICAGDGASAVLNYAMENQDRIMDATRKNPDAASFLMKNAFPQIAACIGSASARAKLNLALRLAVKNQLQILTPQIYVDGYRLCDEDTDLGLEYVLTRLITKDFNATLSQPVPSEAVSNSGTPISPPIAPRQPRTRVVRPSATAAEPANMEQPPMPPASGQPDSTITPNTGEDASASEPPETADAEESPSGVPSVDANEEVSQ